MLSTGSPIGPPEGRDFDGLTVRLTLRHAGEMLNLRRDISKPDREVVTDVEFRPFAHRRRRRKRNRSSRRAHGGMFNRTSAVQSQP